MLRRVVGLTACHSLCYYYLMLLFTALYFIGCVIILLALKKMPLTWLNRCGRMKATREERDLSGE